MEWPGRARRPATWTEYTLLSERLVVPLDQEVATDVTSIVGCAVLTGAGVILNTLGVRVNESVAVFGAGGVGLCAIAAAHIVGAYPIIAVDLSDDKLALLSVLGRHMESMRPTVTPSRPSMRSRTAGWTTP